MKILMILTGGTICTTKGSSGHRSSNTEQVKTLMLEKLIDADVDVDDIEVEDGEMTVYVQPTDLHKAQEAIDELIPDCEYSVCAIKMLPQEYVKLEDEHDKEMWQRLLDNLNEVDDVQEIYHNVEM